MSTRKRKKRSSSPATQLTVNVRLLLVSIAVLVVMVIGGYFWHGYQLRRVSEAFLDRASTLEQESEFSKAASYLYRYLQFHPNDEQVRIRLARTFGKSAANSRRNQAINFYYAALGVADDNQEMELRRELIPLLLMEGRRVEANSEAKALWQANPADPEALRFRALARFQNFQATGNPADPSLQSGEPRISLVKVCDEARENNPHDLELAVNFASVLRSPQAGLFDSQLLAREYPPKAASTPESGQQESDPVIDQPGREGPRDAEVSSTGIAAFSREWREQTADQAIDQMVRDNPDDAEAYVQRFVYRVRTDRVAEAGLDIDQAVQLRPDDSRIRIAAAQFALDPASGRTPSAAIEHLQHVIKMDPENVQAYEGLGMAWKALGNLEQMIEICEIGLRKVDPDNIRLNLMLVDALLSRVQSADPSADPLENEARQTRARQRLEKLQGLIAELNRDPQQGPDQIYETLRLFNLLKGRQHLLQGDYGQAISLTTLVLRQFPGQSSSQADAFLLRAQAYRLAGKPDQAAGDFQQAATADPDSLINRQRSALAWADANQYEKAIAAYERIANGSTDPVTLATMARLLFAQQISRPLRQRDWSGFQVALKKAEDAAAAEGNQTPWQLALLRVESEIAIAGGNPDQDDENSAALMQFQEKLQLVEDVYGAEPLVVRGLITIHENLGLNSTADRLLEKYLAMPVDQVDRILVRADLLESRNQPKQSRELLASELPRLLPVDQTEVARRLARVTTRLLRQSEDPKALLKETSTVLEEIEIRDAESMRILIEAAIGVDDLEQAAAWENQLVGIEGDDGTIWRYCRILRLLRDKNEQGLVSEANLNQALEVQSELEKLRPWWPVASSLKGNILELQARWIRPPGVTLDERRKRESDSLLERALDAYRDAQSQGLESVPIYEGIERTLLALNRFEEADRVWEQLGEQAWTSKVLTNSAIQVAFGLKDLDRAEDLARQNVERWPDDYQAWISYGQLCQINEKYDQALQAFRTATEKAPRQRESWGALFNYYVLLTDWPNARKTLDEWVRRLDLTDGERFYTLAQGFQKLRQISDASDNYDKAVEAEPDNPTFHRSRANFYRGRDLAREEESLKRLVQLTTDNDSARRRLVEVLFRQGKTEQWQKMLEVAESDPRDLRKKAFLLSLQDQPAAINEAIGIFQGIIRNAQGGLVDSSDRFELAKLYLRASRMEGISADDRQKGIESAEDQLSRIVNRNDPNLIHLQFYINFLINAERTEDAQRWLNRLDQLAVDGIPSLRLRGRMLEEAGEIEQLVPLVEAVALKRQREIEQDEFFGPDKKNSLLQAWAREIGLLYSQFELHPAAEKWFRLAVEEEGGLARLAYNLGFQGKVEQAVELCLEKMTTSQTSEPGYVIANLLTQYDNIPGTLREQGRRAIEQQLKDHQNDIRLRMAVADMHAVQNDIPQAIRYYEEVLQRNDRHGSALNNLATLYSEIPEKRQQALEYVNRAIEVSGKVPGWFDTRGMIYLFLGETQKAIEDLQFAVENGNDPRYHFHLAIAYRQSEQKEKAKQSLEKALAMDLESAVLVGSDLEFLTNLKTEFGL